MSKHRDNILKLRNQGKSYNQIVNELGCSKSTIAFHCGKDQKSMARKRHRKFMGNSHPYMKKLSKFCERRVVKNRKSKNLSTAKHLIYIKIREFSTTHEEKRVNNKKGRYIKVNNNFTVNDVIRKFGENPKCYLTGEEIDIYDTRSYHFDHIMPRSRGGGTGIDNLGICTKRANQAKSDMTYDEFVAFCKRVVLVSEKGIEPLASTV